MSAICKTLRGIWLAALCVVAGVSVSSCDNEDDQRIPAMPVNINLADPGVWNIYGVSGFGVWREFIRELRQPASFGWTDKTLTGFGGVLLIGGMDAFSGDTNVPLAYDLSCPVECKRDIRVHVETERFEAVCAVCGSHYDVTTGAGRALSGPAADSRPRLGLRRYECIPGQFGGYYIINRD